MRHVSSGLAGLFVVVAGLLVVLLLIRFSSNANGECRTAVLPEHRSVGPGAERADHAGPWDAHPRPDERGWWDVIISDKKCAMHTVKLCATSEASAHAGALKRIRELRADGAFLDVPQTIGVAPDAECALGTIASEEW